LVHDLEGTVGTLRSRHQLLIFLWVSLLMRAILAIVLLAAPASGFLGLSFSGVF